MVRFLLLGPTGGDPAVAPSFVFARQEMAELLRRRALDHHTDRFQALLDGLVGEALIERLVQLGDDVRRRAARRKQTVPGGDVVAGQQTGLDGRRHIRYRRKTVLAGDGERLELAGVYLADHRRHRVKHDVGMLAEHRVEGFRRGAERHVQQIDLGGLLEHLAGEMLGGGKARTGEHDLAGMLLGVSDQLLDVVGREIRPRHDHQAGSRYLADRRKRGQHVVRHLLGGDGGDNLARGHDSDRVTVGRGARDIVVAQDATGARFVFDDDGLAELGLHRIRQDAADDVGAAAGPERDDHVDGTLRKVLRWRGSDAQQQSGEREPKLLHDILPRPVADLFFDTPPANLFYDDAVIHVSFARAHAGFKYVGMQFEHRQFLPDAGCLIEHQMNVFQGLLGAAFG